jgi:hypothetical protein
MTYAQLLPLASKERFALSIVFFVSFPGKIEILWHARNVCPGLSSLSKLSGLNFCPSKHFHPLTTTSTILAC